jgi:hypothetical protein
MRQWVLVFASALLLVLPSVVQAGLLEDHFGVTLATGSIEYLGNPYTDVFTHDWTPTLNASTVDYVVDDWYGKDALSFSPYMTLHGSVPSGGEPYDVEAIYMDADLEFLYLCFVTSFPPQGYEHPQLPGVVVPPGDIAIGLNGGIYDFGIDINDGTGMIYRTTPSNWLLLDPGHSVAAQGELTNFAGGVPIGPVGIVYQPTGIIENEFMTYRLEVTVPLAYLDYPACGTMIYVHWSCACRNDATGGNPILKLVGDLDGWASATQATTWSSVKSLFR